MSGWSKTMWTIFFFFDTESSASIRNFLDIESRKQQQKD